jgi:hypothetical protein
MKTIKKFFKDNQFYFIFIINCIILWYICEGLLWLEFLLVPYTDFKRIIAVWIHHIACLTVIPFWLTLVIAADISSAKKTK